MAQKISARCNTGPYVFLIFLYLYFYSLSVFATICRTKCYFSRAGQGQQQLIPLNSLVYSIKKQRNEETTFVVNVSQICVSSEKKLILAR